MLTRFDRAVAVIAVIAGPLTLIATSVAQWMLQPTGAHPTPVDAAMQFPASWLFIGILAVLGPLVWTAGLPAAALLCTGRGALLARIGALVTGAGLIAGVGHLSLFFGAYNAIAEAGLDPAAAKHMIAATDQEPLGNALLVLFLVCYSIGPVLLSLGLRMARRVPVWTPVAAVVTAGATLFGGPIAGVVQLAALAALWGAVAVAVVRVREVRPRPAPVSP